MQEVSLIKEVYGRSTYTKVIDTQFSELYTPVTASQQSTQISVEQFFDYYNQLFFQIPATGEVNSHEYLVKKSTEYLGGGVLTDTEQAYIEEINSLRQQLLEANANYLNLNEVI
tara:strand:+ start:218 stop:559 length:342 start_codon:yes stop_codon:yes gene_type:complete